MSELASRNGGHILLVEDEASFRELAAGWLTRHGHRVSFASDATQVRQQLDNPAYSSFDLILLDLAMPPSFDPEHTLQALLPEIRQQAPKLPVIVITGHSQQTLAITAIANGADDFLGKPIDPGMLKVVIERTLERSRLRQQVSALEAQIAANNGPADHLGILGNSQSLERLRTLIRRMAVSDLPVLIGGQSGTGKELVAKALHELSPRANGPMVTVNCAAIPAELIESELFGYVKGAFTGANNDRVGLIGSAAGGSLFLDELGEMPLNMQAKLLRVLQDGDFYPVGARCPEQADVRVIAATHRDLAKEVVAGNFREDLYYRLRGLQLHCPTLADRPEDIPLLARHFARRRGNRLPSAVMDWLVQRPWPGNVRELKHAVESASALAPLGQPIALDDLRLCCGETDLEATQAAPQGQGTLDEQLARLEKSLLVAALDECQGNHTHAARRLGISRMGLLKKMSRLGLR